MTSDRDNTWQSKSPIDGKVVFITGCGSFAIAFANHICTTYKPKKVVFLSRNESKQEEARQKVVRPGSCRWILGDIRDSRFKHHISQAQILIHTASLKRVPAIEYNPVEAASNIVEGTANVASACVDTGVEKAVFLSTDKAVFPVNHYGVCKGAAERLWLGSNVDKQIFSATRYGNVMGSSDSVLPIYQAVPRGKPFPITDKRMTRFWVTMDEAVGLVLQAVKSQFGSIILSKTKGFKVTDLARAIRTTAQFNVKGIRPGEKIHELLVSEHEAHRTIDCTDFYWMAPEIKYAENQHWPTGDVKGPVQSDDSLMSVEEIKEKL